MGVTPSVSWRVDRLIVGLLGVDFEGKSTLIGVFVPDASSSSRRGPPWRRRWASGFGCPPIYGSGGFWCLGRDRGGGGVDLCSAFGTRSPAPRRCGVLRAAPWSFSGSSGASAEDVCLGFPWTAVEAGGGAAVVTCLHPVALAFTASRSLWPAVVARGEAFWWCFVRAEGFVAQLWRWVGGSGGGSSGTALSPRRQEVLELVGGVAWPCSFSVEILLLAASELCGLLQCWRFPLFQAAGGSCSSSPAFSGDVELRWFRSCSASVMLQAERCMYGSAFVFLFCIL